MLCRIVLCHIHTNLIGFIWLVHSFVFQKTYMQKRCDMFLIFLGLKGVCGVCVQTDLKCNKTRIFDSTELLEQI